MILVDTSIWIDHLHRPEPQLTSLLGDVLAAAHPMIIGELALGTMRQRSAVLQMLSDLPGTTVATHTEVLDLVESHKLFGIGLSLVDAHLLAAVRLDPQASIWTRDRRLHAAAQRLGVAADLDD